MKRACLLVPSQSSQQRIRAPNKPFLYFLVLSPDVVCALLAQEGSHGTGTGSDLIYASPLGGEDPRVEVRARR